MQIIAEFTDRTVADSAAGLLQDAGITTALMMDDAAPPTARDASFRVRVAVRDEDAERAASALRAANLLPRN